MTESRHLSIHINRTADEVYDFTSQLANLPLWAAGVSADMVIEFAARNEFGVLDHWATVDGMRFYNPMRVIVDDSGCEVVFTLRRAPGVEDAAFAADATTIEADLATLKRILEN